MTGIKWPWRWWRDWRRQTREHEARHALAWTDAKPRDGGLSPFQEQCESALTEALADRGFNLGNREVSPVSDWTGAWQMVHAKVIGTDISVWIYNDGADVRSGTSCLQCLEHWDFAAPGDLIVALVEKVSAALPHRR